MTRTTRSLVLDSQVAIKNDKLGPPTGIHIGIPQGLVLIAHQQVGGLKVVCPGIQVGQRRDFCE